MKLNRCEKVINSTLLQERQSTYKLCCGEMEFLKERVKRVVAEKVAIVPYNPDWPRMFELERDRLLNCLPNELIKRIEHFGSTAIPGMSAKPIVDILVEVTSLVETKKKIVPVLEAKGYDYFWRPTMGEDIPHFMPGLSNEIPAASALTIFTWWKAILPTGTDYYSGTI